MNIDNKNMMFYDELAFKENYFNHVKGELLDFQQEIITCTEPLIIFNGCRNATKTFTLVKWIEFNLPKNILYVTDYDCMFEDFLAKIEKYTNFKMIKEESIFTEEQYSASKHDIYGAECLRKVELKLNDNIVNLYFDIDCNVEYDCVLYDDSLHLYLDNKNNIRTKKNIITLTKNNFDGWIQKYYADAKVFQFDSKYIVRLGLLNKRHLDRAKEECLKSKQLYKYYNEYEILSDNPDKLKVEDEVSLDYKWFCTDKRFQEELSYRYSLNDRKFTIGEVIRHRWGGISYKLKDESRNLEWSISDFKTK